VRLARKIAAMRSPIAPLFVLAAACSSTSPPTAPPSPQPAQPAAWQPAAPRSPLVLRNQAVDPNVLSPLPRGSRAPLAAIPAAATGRPAIALPDGVRLPALNGVAASMEVRYDKPIAAVVGVYVDERGFEWYEHADGALTSCRYAWRKDLARWDGVAMHLVPTDEPAKH
jgi:hypothetical protein